LRTCLKIKVTLTSILSLRQGEEVFKGTLASILSLCQGEEVFKGMLI
jgi:hypothetical protein